MFPLKSRYVPRNINWAVWLIVFLCTLVFIWELGASKEQLQFVIYNPKTHDGLIGSIFGHSSWTHLIGNMIVLLVFGKGVVDKIGNIKFIILFLLFGISGCIMHGLYNEIGLIGASGAICGVVAMSFILLPFVEIKTMVWMLPPVIFDIASFWIAGIWFVYDFFLMHRSIDRISYHAHVGGFLSGLIVAIVVVRMGWIKYYGSEKSFLHLFLGIRDVRPPISTGISGGSA